MLSVLPVRSKQSSACLLCRSSFCHPTFILGNLIRLGDLRWLPTSHVRPLFEPLSPILSALAAPTRLCYCDGYEPICSRGRSRLPARSYRRHHLGSTGRRK